MRWRMVLLHAERGRYRAYAVDHGLEAVARRDCLHQASAPVKSGRPRAAVAQAGHGACQPGGGVERVAQAFAAVAAADQLAIAQQAHACHCRGVRAIEPPRAEAAQHAPGRWRRCRPRYRRSGCSSFRYGCPRSPVRASPSRWRRPRRQSRCRCGAGRAPAAARSRPRSWVAARGREGGVSPSP